jgi:hypothetical protein
MRQTDLTTRFLIVAMFATAVPAACAADPDADPARAPARLGDRYVVTIDPEIRDAPATGRIVLFFTTPTLSGWAEKMPARGPFWESPQPIASIAVEDLAPGEAVVIDHTAVAFPGPLDALDGPARVQAVLDVDQTERSHLHGPGNLLSDPRRVRLHDDADDEVRLTLSKPVPGFRVRRERSNLRWVELRSEMLSAFYGRDVFHRAGVVLPPEYLRADDADDRGRTERWPAIYIIPSFGDRHEIAGGLARSLSEDNPSDILPHAVYIVLDPESPLGHHGFADSPNNGPRGTALVEEFIPHLERRFGLVSEREARLLSGHSSGGWTVLWFQLNHPETFGGCWATAPDPIDFHAFLTCDLYDDANLYFDDDGRERPGYRRIDGPAGEMRILMTVREECRMEYAIDSYGRSGEQWDTWEAMFSPRDRRTGLPMPICDPDTGAIDHDVVDHWRGYDMSALVEREWDRLGPVVMQRVHLSCGDLDSFYLDRAVKRFKSTVDSLADASGGWVGSGYVEIVPRADHYTIAGITYRRRAKEMREHLRRHGLRE